MRYMPDGGDNIIPDIKTSVVEIVAISPLEVIEVIIVSTKVESAFLLRPFTIFIVRGVSVVYFKFMIEHEEHRKNGIGCV